MPRTFTRLAGPLSKSPLSAVVLSLGLLSFAGCGPPQRVVHDLAAKAEGSGSLLGAHVEFDGAEPASRRVAPGWSAPEESDGRTYVWALGLRATLRAPILVQDPAWLHFRARPFEVADGPPQTVSVELEGTPLGNLALEPDFADYTLSIPPSVWTDAVVETGDEALVTFRFSRSSVPADETPGNQDRRDLAVAFDRLILSTEADAAVALSVERPSREIDPGRIRQRAASEWIVAVGVPDRAPRLEFALLGSPTSTGRIAVRLADGREEELHVGPAAESAVRQRIDLDAYAGERLELHMQVFDDEPTAYVAWDEPVVSGAVAVGDRQTQVVWIVVDTLRADVLSCYGGEARTPNIDALAASGVLFERAYAHAPMTVPSHSSMLTSLLPTEHGATNNGMVLGERHVTLAELMQDSGRRTAGFVSLGVLDRQFGFAQGFDDYYSIFGDDWWKTGAEVNQDALPWIRDAATDPYFAWVHYSDPHEPYAAPDQAFAEVELSLGAAPVAAVPIDGRSQTIPMTLRPGENRLSWNGDVEAPLALRGVRADPPVTIRCGDDCRRRRPSLGREFDVESGGSLVLDHDGTHPLSIDLRVRTTAMLTIPGSREAYRKEVEYVDREIGRLLEAIDQAGNREGTLIVLTSDHGEGLGDHGLLGHVHQLYDSLTRVPLIVSWPGRFPGGRVVSGSVSHVDLLPTMVEALGLHDPVERVGRSLLGVLERGEPLSPEIVVSETFRPESRRDLRSIVQGRVKLIRDVEADSYELFRLEQDPAELTDLADRDEQAVARLRELLRRRVEQAEGRAVIGKQGELSDDDLERLRGLGYVR